MRYAGNGTMGSLASASLLTVVLAWTSGAAWAQLAPGQPAAEARDTDAERSVGAREILGSSVSDGFEQHVGTVRDLVLNPEGTAVQYVLYEVPHPYRVHAEAGGDGFVTFDEISFERGATFGTRVRFDRQPADDDRETLRLTRGEADRRLLSRMIGESVEFADQQTLPLEDVLLDQQTGEITHYLVNVDEDALFAADTRRIPADQVRIGERGEVRSMIEFAALEGERDQR
ncbi:MAG: hypothetical protein ACNA7W_16530 [Pseudomonadales bacterium]